MEVIIHPPAPTPFPEPRQQNERADSSSGREGTGPTQPRPSPGDGHRPDRLTRAFHLLHRALPILAAVIFGIAIYFIHHVLKAHSWREIVGYVRSIPLGRRLTAMGLTVCSYLVLSTYDILGFVYIQRPLGRLKIAFASITAFAFSNNIGLANLAGSSIRLRIYSTYGVDPKDTLKIIAFCSATFWIGFFALAGTMLMLFPLELPPSFGISANFIRGAGLVLLAIAVAYIALSAIYHKPITIRGVTFQLPSLKLSLFQILVAAGDWAVAGLVLYLLLPAESGLTYPQFLSVFISAQVLALLAHVPGGVGILEALVIYFVSPGHEPTSNVLGALLAYRAIYYLMPLMAAAAGLIGYEIYRKRHVVQLVSQQVGSTALSWTGLILPQVASMMAFVAGAVLLISDVTPSAQTRLNQIGAFLPLGVIEAAHFLAGCVGAALLLQARALTTRGRAAWTLALGLLVSGAVLSILKGFGLEEATLLTCFALLLALTRGQFHRRVQLWHEGLSATWIATVAMVIGGSIWLGFAVRREFVYNDALWSTFSLTSEGPRYLRASVGGVLTATTLAITYAITCARDRARALARVALNIPPYAPPDVSQIERILQHWPSEPAARLALAPETGTLFSASGGAYLIYRPVERLWYAFGDPVGNPEEFEDLVLDFDDLARRSGARPIYFAPTAERLPLFLDLGAIRLSLGDEALVDLNSAPWQALAQARCTNGFEVIEPASAEHARMAHETGLPSVFPIARLLSPEGQTLSAASVLRGSRESAIERIARVTTTAATEELILHLMREEKERGARRFSLGLIDPEFGTSCGFLPSFTTPEFRAQLAPDARPRFATYPEGVRL